MPLLEVTAESIKQQCLHCGCVHTIPLFCGYSKAKRGPYALADGDTLEVTVDGGDPQTVVLEDADFADIRAAQSEEVVTKLNASLTGVACDVDEGAVRISSESSDGSCSCVEVTGGTAREKLGFDGRRCGARMLGASRGHGDDVQVAADTIELPHCPECGAKECLVRTWDACPAGYEHTAFYKHRRAVNALAHFLKTQGNSCPAAKAMHDGESQTPPDFDLEFPGRTLSVPSAFRGA